MINPIVYRFIKEAYASDQEILDVASQYYDNDDPDDPKRRWDHVLDDIEVAKKIRGRDLTPVELGTLAFHDSGYMNPNGYMWGLKNHPKLSRKRFMKEAPGLGFSDDEIKHMAKVISYHMRTPKKGSPLLKDDLQMLMFGADEGTPKKPVDDARKYFMKAVAGRYPEVPDKSDPQFVKKLVERVRTFKDYSNAPGLEYYHRVYPNYHKELYNYWHSDQIIEDYEKMSEDEKKGKSLKQKSEKKNDKYTIHGAILGCLGDNAKKFKYNITEDLPDDPWGAIINTKPMTMDKVKQFHSYHNIDVDGAGVPYYFLTKNERTGDKYVWYSDDEEPIRINTKEEKELAKNVGLEKGLVPDQLDFKFTEKKSSFDYPDLRVNPKNKITRLIKNLKWGVKVDGKLDSTDELLFEPDPNKKYEVIADDTSDIASCVDLTNRVVKNTKGIGSLATLRSDSDIPHLTPMFKYKGKYYLRSGSHKYSDPYDTLDEVGDRWYKTTAAGPVPEYIDFYDLPAGETIEEKDLRKIINEVKKKSKKTYRKSYTDRPGYKKEKKASKLYTYVEPDADLSKGILSASLAPEDILMRRYKGHDYATSKEDILKFFDEMYPTRAKNIYALDAPIPDNANEQLIRFRNARKLVSFDAEQIKDLIKITRRRTNGPPIETTPDFEPRKHVKWGRDPKKVMKHPGRGPFHYAPVYTLLTESGRIPPELLTEEDEL